MEKVRKVLCIPHTFFANVMFYISSLIKAYFYYAVLHENHSNHMTLCEDFQNQVALKSDSSQDETCLWTGIQFMHAV